MRISNAASQNWSTKGPPFREDDCTLPVYLKLLIYAADVLYNILYKYIYIYYIPYPEPPALHKMSDFVSPPDIDTKSSQYLLDRIISSAISAVLSLYILSSIRNLSPHQPITARLLSFPPIGHIQYL